MKKLALYFLGFTFTTLTIISCGSTSASTKKGCGLTSDANKFEQNTTVNNITNIVATK